MKIWQLDIEVDKYKCLKLVDNSEWNLFDNLDGRKLLNSWHPIKVEFTKSKKNKKVPDAFYLSPSAPVFNLNAIEVLKEFIQRDMELLPLENINGEKYFIINPLLVIDALDNDESEFQKFSDGRIMWCIKYAFIKEKIEGVNVFRITVTPRTFIFVSDGFRNKVIESSLTGFIFKEVWDSEKV